MPPSEKMPLNEENIIQKYFAPLSEGSLAACGFEDDCALLGEPHEGHRVITSDMLVEGVHFFDQDRARDIAWKALAVNVSDIIASGGRPEYYLLSIGLNERIDEDWLAEFSEGLMTAQNSFKIKLIGGDTTRSRGPLTISITAMGDVSASRHTIRGGARPGDGIYVTGTIGDSSLGCALRGNKSLRSKWGLSDADHDFLIERYLRPAPRMEMIDYIGKFASASLDISDGLILDFSRLANASRIGAVMDADNVSLSGAARKVLQSQSEMLGGLLSGGDDYELVMTVPADKESSFLKAVSGLKFPVKRIGTCTDKYGTVSWQRASEEPLCFDISGFDHFNYW